jgi:hypothetical protein
MSQPGPRPSIPNLFQPSLLEWRAKYLAAKAAQTAASNGQPAAARPAAVRRRPQPRR